MSKPETISGFRVEASTNCLKQIAGLKFAKSLSAFLNLSNALSGFLEKSKLSHLGPPTAPKITASHSKALKNTSSVMGVLNLSYAAPPTKS